MVRRQLGGLEPHKGIGQRMRNALVLPNGPRKDNALARVRGRPAQRGVAQAQRLAGQQTALGIHAVQDLAEPVALLGRAAAVATAAANEGVGGDGVVVKVDLVGVDGAAAHLLDGPDGEARVGAVEVDAEEGEALGGLADLVAWGGACEEHHFLGDLGAGDPDLLARHLVAAPWGGIPFGGCR